MKKKNHPQKSKALPAKEKKTVAAGLTDITFTTTFYSGAGGIYFHGEGIVDNQYISSEMADKSFTVRQNPGHQIVTVAGSAPASGKIMVKVTQGSKVLSAATDNVFDKLTFSGFIIYNC